MGRAIRERDKEKRHSVPGGTSAPNVYSVRCMELSREQQGGRGLARLVSGGFSCQMEKMREETYML